MSLTDFNDLHVEQGVDAVRTQLLKAILEPSLPAPLNKANAEAKNQENEAVFNTTFSIEILLERFAYIMGEDKVWDTQEKLIHKKLGFKTMVGKPLSEEWLNHGSKKFISISNVRSAQKNLPISAVGGVGVEEMLERYVLIYGTKDVWDSSLRIRMPANTLELARPNEYDFWLKSGVHRRMVLPEHIVFDPTMRSPETHINTFDGLPLKPISKADIGDKCWGIHELLRSMCETDHVFNYVLRWLALPLQKTGTKLASAILFHRSGRAHV